MRFWEILRKRSKYDQFATQPSKVEDLVLVEWIWKTFSVNLETFLEVHLEVFGGLGGSGRSRISRNQPPESEVS